MRNTKSLGLLCGKLACNVIGVPSGLLPTQQNLGMNVSKTKEKNVAMALESLCKGANNTVLVPEKA